jgi:hypothetical protein
MLLTMLTILLIVVLLIGLGCMVNSMMNGCPFAWVWYIMGGMESTVQLIGTLFEAITSGSSSE